MNLDCSNAVIILNVLPLAASTIAAEKDSLVVLCSMFRLLATTTRVLNDGSVEEIDAVLGCPLYMFDVPTARTKTEGNLAVDIDNQDFRDFFQSLQKKRDRDLVMYSCFLAVNWIRELLNAFCIDGMNKEMAMKTRQRLRDLVSLEEKLDICAQLNPSTKLVLPNLNQPSLDLVKSRGPLRPKRERPEKVSAKRAAKKPKNTNVTQEPLDEDAQYLEMCLGESPSLVKRNVVQTKTDDGIKKMPFFATQCKPLCRELLLSSASCMLKGTESEDQVYSFVKDPQVMHYLMLDLLDKLSYVVKKDRSRPFGGHDSTMYPALAKMDIRAVVKIIMPILCTLKLHLEELGNALRETTHVDEDNDNDDDDDDDEEAEQKREQLPLWVASIITIGRCLQHLLECRELSDCSDGRAVLSAVLHAISDNGQTDSDDSNDDNRRGSTNCTSRAGGDPRQFVNNCEAAFEFLHTYAKDSVRIFPIAAQFMTLLNLVENLSMLHAADGFKPKLRLALSLSELAGFFLEVRRQ